MADTPTPTQDYFLNFFDLGIDFLMDGSRNVLRKVILHSNTPGETQFGRYERCPWQIVVASNASISSGDSVSKALAFLSKQDSDNAISVIKNSKKAAQNPKGFLLDRTADMPDTLQSSKPTGEQFCTVDVYLKFIVFCRDFRFRARSDRSDFSRGNRDIMGLLKNPTQAAYLLHLLYIIFLLYITCTIRIEWTSILQQ